MTVEHNTPRGGVAQGLPSLLLHPLVAAKYYDTPAKRLLFDFIREFLGVDVIGFQAGFGKVETQILFNEPVYRTTLAIPTAVMLEPMERARQIVQERIREKHKAFETNHTPEPGEIFAYS